MSAVLRRGLVVGAICSLVAALVGPALAATRPPAPAGSLVLGSPPPRPHACVPGEAETGVYWSETSKAWLSSVNCYIQWRGFEGTTVTPSLIAPGDSVTITLAGGSVSGNVLHKSFQWPQVFKVVKGCTPKTPTCTVRVGKKGDARPTEWGWQMLQGFGPIQWNDQYDAGGQVLLKKGGVAGPTTNGTGFFAIIPKGQSIIEGRVVNRDGGGVGGVTVELVSKKGGRTQVVTTSASGDYLANVKPGTYTVWPRGGPSTKKRAARYKPETQTATVAFERSARMKDFVLDAGLDVEVVIPATTPADGVHVVEGRITVLEYGKPKPKAQVRLAVMPELSYDDAVWKAPRMTVCSAGTRVWPTGGLHALSGAWVTVTTDDKGVYPFTLAVGTVPGKWTIEATGLTSTGSASYADGTGIDSATMTLEPVGSKPVEAFADEIAFLAKGGTRLAGVGGPDSLETTMREISEIPPKAIKRALAGLEYALVWVQPKTKPAGTGLLVWPANRPPMFDADKNVLSPGAVVLPWTLRVGDAGESLRAGALNVFPTFEEVVNGSTIKGWTLEKGTKIGISSDNVLNYGWSRLTSASPGAC